jgi:hypothetical protein
MWKLDIPNKDSLVLVAFQWHSSGILAQARLAPGLC